MKNVCLVFALCLFTINGLCAVVGVGNNVHLNIVWDDPTGDYPPNPKSPQLPLVISQDDNIFTLPATPVDYTLELRDEIGYVIYTVFIPTGTTQIVLPTTLSGTFEIRLVANTYYYIGYIVL